MINTIYDFSRLFLNFYSEEEQDLIMKCGNYWTNRLCKVNWYTPDIFPSLYLKNQNEDNIIWITLINKGYINYTKNFLESMKKNGISFKLLVYYIGDGVKDELSNYSDAVCFDASFFLDKTFSSNLCNWSSIEYKKIVFAKLDAIKYTIEKCKYYNIKYAGYIDTDIVILKNPSEVVHTVYKNNPELSVIYQCDENTLECTNINKCPNLCSGIIAFDVRKTDIGWFNYCDNDISKYPSDQHFLVEKLKKINQKSISKSIFLNGSYPGLKNATIQLPDTAATVHFNYLIGNNKQNCMKKNNMWYI
jgi:hypothetical protein